MRKFCDRATASVLDFVRVRVCLSASACLRVRVCLRACAYLRRHAVKIEKLNKVCVLC